MHLAGDHDERVLLTGGLLRLGETVLVALAVAEAERVLGRDAGADFGAGIRVEKAFQPVARADAHVMAALRAHVEVAFQLRAIQHRIAGGALDPQAFGDRARAALRLDARRHDFLEPRHVFAYWKKSSRRFFRYLAIRPPAKSAVF